MFRWKNRVALRIVCLCCLHVGKIMDDHCRVSVQTFLLMVHFFNQSINELSARITVSFSSSHYQVLIRAASFESRLMAFHWAGRRSWPIKRIIILVFAFHLISIPLIYFLQKADRVNVLVWRKISAMLSSERDESSKAELNVWFSHSMRNVISSPYFPCSAFASSHRMNQYWSRATIKLHERILFLFLLYSWWRQSQFNVKTSDEKWFNLW